jgi:hypothetical protein
VGEHPGADTGGHADSIEQVVVAIIATPNSPIAHIGKYTRPASATIDQPIAQMT